MKKKKGFYFLSGLGIAAAAAVTGYIIKNKKGNSAAASMDGEDEIFFNFTEETSVSYKKAEELALEKAREKLGKGAAVVSASDNKALTINIDGKRRHCFMFGAVADNLSITPETLLIYVDASTGEVFLSSEIKD